MSERGAAVVEFAIVLPVLLLIVFGGMGLSWWILQRFQLQALAEDTVHAVTAELEAIMLVSPATVDCFYSGGPGAGCDPSGRFDAYDRVEIRISEPADAWPFLPDSVVLEAVAVRVVTP